MVLEIGQEFKLEVLVYSLVLLRFQELNDFEFYNISCRFQRKQIL